MILPLLNQRLDWLEKAVRSSVMQTVATETVVVTSPRTEARCRHLLSDLAENEKSLVIVEDEADTGFAAAINLGIRRARAERVGFLLSDDWLESTAVEICLHHHTDIVSTGLTHFRQSDTRLIPQPHPILTQETFDALPTLESKARHLEHFFLFDRALLLRVGGVDETVGLVGPDDYDLIWTLLEHGASVTVVEDRLYNYREHAGDRLSLRSYEDKRADLLRILDKHGVTGAERQMILYGQRSQHFASDS